MSVWKSSTYEIPICCAHSWFAFSPVYFPGIPEFSEREEVMVDDGQVVLFGCWVLEDADDVVAAVDPLRWAICLLPSLHIVIFTLLLFAHQSVTWGEGSCVSSFHVGGKSLVSCERKRSYHLFHAEAAILFLKWKKKKKQSVSLSLSWWNQKKAIMDHLSSHSHGSNPSLSLSHLGK